MIVLAPIIPALLGLQTSAVACCGLSPNGKQQFIIIKKPSSKFNCFLCVRDSSRNPSDFSSEDWSE
jgi:hypothetical protein